MREAADDDDEDLGPDVEIADQALCVARAAALGGGRGVLWIEHTVTDVGP